MLYLLFWSTKIASNFQIWRWFLLKSIYHPFYYRLPVLFRRKDALYITNLLTIVYPLWAFISLLEAAITPKTPKMSLLVYFSDELISFSLDLEQVSKNWVQRVKYAKNFLGSGSSLCHATLRARVVWQRDGHAWAGPEKNRLWTTSSSILSVLPN